ncbi:type III-B CRISPR module-associated Cmr3 family protein [Nitrosomonas sp.]|uniref:type III-B CRISPR module-associated Cmr3 family protein n=1 Tax=Nitrosomonas sp. TaxID=42353 RepID=UPI00208CB4A9|nr:type III-B CRISPR module-associated Cmr3 family protein [Nitrosomonas sp.]GJL75018.1 MAG: hypothetical protein NMNS02_11240 [Nitrosomonas sp.]
MSEPTRETWCFHALDTLFFRESRPMDSIGNSELTSLFPPSARTMIGAIRSVIGECAAINWREYHELKEKHELAQVIGYGDDNLGCLSFEGVWVQKESERLYPAPLNVMRQTCGDREELFLIKIGEKSIQTDIGHVRLPELQKGREGSRTLENIWLTADEYSLILSGGLLNPDRWFKLKPVSVHAMDSNCLLVEEPRVGIARDNALRNVQQGLLYQTRHVRLTDDVSLCMDISGVPDQYGPTQHYLTRLGGEGRMAAITIKEAPEFLSLPDLVADSSGVVHFVLYLLTPLLITHKNASVWQPLPGFKAPDEGEQAIWEGNLNGIDLKLHTAITGKAHREGGWDMPNHKPKPVKSYIPAGSVFYCTSTVNPREIIEILHGSRIGEEQKLGRGKIAVGVWE